MKDLAIYLVCGVLFILMWIIFQEVEHRRF
jgi:hypothetical protein